MIGEPAPNRQPERRPQVLYIFQLRLANGEPADPPKAELGAAVWGPGSEILLTPKKRLRVLDQDGDTLTVEPVNK